MRAEAGGQRLAAAIAEYAKLQHNRSHKLLHCLYVSAIVFSVIGLLVAINFGITLIALAAAILYYNRFGQRAVLQMSVLLLIMLVVWLMIMPSHHLVLIALGIFILACTGQFADQIYLGTKPSFFEDIQYLFIAPLYVLAALKARLARDPRLDPL